MRRWWLRPDPQYEAGGPRASRFGLEIGMKTVEVIVTLSFDEECDPMPAARFLASEINGLFRTMNPWEEMPGIERWAVEVVEPT